MSEVVPRFAKFCFDTFSLHRLSAEAYANNPAPARFGKGRFRLEGRLRKHVVQRRKILDSLSTRGRYSLFL